MAEHGNVVYSFAHQGALSANWVVYFEMPHAFMPRHVSAVGTNDHNGTIMIGIEGDTDSLLTAQAIGESGNPAEFGPSDFADADEQIGKGVVMIVTIVYGGSGGTAVADLAVAITGLFGE